jgi:hypothetical protein
MKLSRELELRIAQAIGSRLADYLRNGAVQDLQDMNKVTEHERNQARNYLEELAIKIEYGRLPCAGCRQEKLVVPQYTPQETKAATEEED